MEQRAIGLAFDHFDALGMTGLVLEVEGEVVAFAMGNPIRPDMFDVNFEKARADMNGPYPMINREFARRIAETPYRFLNREDDMGLEGLRRAKESYIPDLLLEKLLAEELPHEGGADATCRPDAAVAGLLRRSRGGGARLLAGPVRLHTRLSAPRAGRQPRCHAVRTPGRSWSATTETLSLLPISTPSARPLPCAGAATAACSCRRRSRTL